MYNDLALRKKGFYGEGVPRDAGAVILIYLNILLLSSFRLNISPIVRNCGHCQNAWPHNGPRRKGASQPTGKYYDKGITAETPKTENK